MKAPALGGVLLLAGLGAGLVSVPPRLSIESNSQASGAAVRIEEAYVRLPLSFEPNQGQTDARVRFVSHGPGYALFLTGDGAVLSLHGGGPQRRPRTAGPGLFAPGPWAEPGPARPAVTLSLRLVNANPGAQLEPLDELPGKSNYFLGNDRLQWRTNVPHYARVRYRQVYPGIDLVYYGNPAKAGQLEYDFVVAAGADPKAIRLVVEGADATEVSAEGDLVLRASGEEARFQKPVVYQETAGRRREIAGRFVLATPQPAPAKPGSGVSTFFRQSKTHRSTGGREAKARFQRAFPNSGFPEGLIGQPFTAGTRSNQIQKPVSETVKKLILNISASICFNNLAAPKRRKCQFLYSFFNGLLVQRLQPPPHAQPRNTERRLKPLSEKAVGNGLSRILRLDPGVNAGSNSPPRKPAGSGLPSLGVCQYSLRTGFRSFRLI
jgi:hypothetical protein